MSKQRTKDDVRRLTAVWQERLHMQHWKVETVFEFECGEEDANASIHTANDYEKATIYWDPDYWKHADDADFQHTLLHELLHCVTWGLRLAQKSILYQGLLTRDAEQMYDDRFMHEWENTVDRLARIVYDAYGPA